MLVPRAEPLNETTGELHACWINHPEYAGPGTLLEALDFLSLGHCRPDRTGLFRHRDPRTQRQRQPHFLEQRAFLVRHAGVVPGCAPPGVASVARRTR